MMDFTISGSIDSVRARDGGRTSRDDFVLLLTTAAVSLLAIDCFFLFTYSARSSFRDGVAETEVLGARDALDDNGVCDVSESAMDNREDGRLEDGGSKCLTTDERCVLCGLRSGVLRELRSVRFSTVYLRADSKYRLDGVAETGLEAVAAFFAVDGGATSSATADPNNARLTLEDRVDCPLGV
jgi:hypothetical protein